MSRARWLLATAAALLALTAAACGGTPAETEPGPTSSQRVVSHAMGKTTVVGTPKRVIVLDTGELDSVLALGVKPVGAVAADATQGLQSYLSDRTQGVETVGTINEPNLERIAALQPDLILSNKVRHADIYDKLSRIAPTVFAEKVGVAWKDNFLLAGQALGKKDEAETVLADYKRQAQALGRSVGDPARLEVSMARFLSDSIRLYGEGSFIGTILEDAGFSRPAVQQVDKTFVEVSREQISQADGDVIFYGAYGPAGKAQQEQLTAAPLWQNLSAVRAGKAYEVNDDVWYLGIGPIAADLVLTDLEKHLAGF